MASLKTLCLVLVIVGRVFSQVDQGGENPGDTVTVGGSTSDDGTDPDGGVVVTISGSNTDGVASSTTQNRDEIEVDFEFTVINKRYIVEKNWLPKFCPVADNRCNKAPLNNLAQNPFNTPTLNDCLLNCLKTMGCRGFNLVDQGSDVECELLSDRCADGGVADAGTTYYDRLKDTESDADCPPGSGPPVGPRRIWQNNYCFRSGHDCQLAELTDPSGFYTGALSKSSIVECSRYCSWNPTCAGAVWDFQQPRHCLLLEERCDESDLVPNADLTYLYRLKQGESCTGEQEFLDTDTSQWSGRYCFSEDKYCPGGDVYINFQRFDEQDCLGKCARIPGCQSTAYFYDDAADKPQCMPKYKRCAFNNLVDRTGYTEYYRLMIGEDCPVTRIDGLPPTTFQASFCKASGMECPNFSFFNMPVVTANEAECLTLCVTTGGCQSVFFQHGQGINECSLKSERCDDADLEPFAGGDDYYRLQNGEECPPGRVADDSSWSARFCFAPDRVCGGNDIQSSYDGTTMTFQHCLTLCVDTPLCRAAQFDDNGFCTLKAKVCEVDDLTEAPTNNYYARLTFGDNCDTYKVPKTPTCPPNSEYSDTASGCPKQCRDLDNSDCTIAPNPGCECIEGYAFDDEEECIKIEECDCYDKNGIPRPVGDEWRSLDCETTYECVLNGNEPEIVETDTPCEESVSACEIVDNKPVCTCINGYEPDPAVTPDPDPECVPVLVCPEGSTFDNEASACQAHCGHLNPPTCVDTQIDCVCDDLCAVWLDDSHNECVSAASCGCYHLGVHRDLDTTWNGPGCKELMCDESKTTCYAEVVELTTGCEGENEICDPDDNECVCAPGYVYDGTYDKCILDCPPNSTYNPAGSACPSTCSTGFDNESTCSDTEETCECDDCYVKDGDTCVHASTCQYCYETDGTQHHISDDPWLSGDCDTVYECVEGDSSATTEPACQPHITDDPHTCPGDNKICVDGECQCPADRVEDANGDCILGCPDYSTYNAQGSACPSTCATGPGNEANCSEEQETCECVECYAKNLQTGACEPAADCDECPNNGDPKPVGTSWKSNDCTTKYTCNEGEMNTDECWPYVTSEAYECPGYMAVCNNGECGCPDGRVQQPNGDCILDCPPNSTYNPSGSACQSTCSTGFDNESTCSDTEETCECDDCYVKDGDTCVHASTCQYCYETDGTQHHISDDPWLSGDCDTVYECVEGDSSATTEPACQPHITDDPHTCPGDNKICVDGECDCPLDRVEDANGDCILGCPDYSTYNAQGSACPSTCATGPGNEATCSEVEEACECDECYAKNLQTGECEPAEDCDECLNNGDPKSVGQSWNSNDCTVKYTCNEGEMNTDECWPYVTSESYECPGYMAVCNNGECGCPDGRVQQPNGDCILDCPPGTVYNQYGSACESTCETGPGNEDTCTETAEICECADNCHAKKLDDGTCIPAEECNLCTDGSMNYPVGDTFLNEDCSLEYECVAGDNSNAYPACWPQLTAVPHSCPGAHQICSPEGGECVCPDDRVMDDNDDCILPCPDNSEYSPDSASQCPITCDTVGADQSGCGMEEGCICNDCFVYNAETGQCDAGSSCEVCVDADGNIHQLHDTFLSDDCTTEFVCQEGNCYNELSATPHECPELHVCDNAGHCVCEEGHQPDPDDPEICVPIPTTAPPCPPGQPLGPIDIVVQTSTRVVIGSGGSCPHNSQHNPAASPCPATCHNPFNHVYCPHAPEPGCECHQHHLYDHMLGQCIHKDECGCHLNDVAHPVGSSWFNDDCTILHMCKSGADGPVIDQYAYTCPEHSSCVSGEEGHHCVCNAGYTQDADGNCTIV